MVKYNLDKLLKCIVLVSVLFLLTGCSGENQANSKDDTLNASKTSSYEKEADKKNISDNGTAGSELKSETIDNYSDDKLVDLTTMGSDMIYATVFQMMTNPDHYIGKSINVEGEFYMYKDDATGDQYYYVIVEDATSCCAQGLQFVWEDGNHIFPDEYPEIGSNIKITGEFETYIDAYNGMTYSRLRNSSMTVIS